MNFVFQPGHRGCGGLKEDTKAILGMPDAACVVFFSQVAKNKENRGTVLCDMKYYRYLEEDMMK